MAASANQGTALALVPERPANALIRPVLDAVQSVALHHEIMRQVVGMLVENIDFGTIPDTKKETLFKAGAERLCTGFGLVDRYEIIDREIDHEIRFEYQKRKRGAIYASGEAFGLYRYVVRCTLSRREDGVVVSEGLGSACSLEAKYCDRPREVENTILKMAKKRAKVDATLAGLGLSDRFTQDVEDFEDSGHSREVREARAPAAKPPNESAESLDPKLMILPFAREKWVDGERVLVCVDGGKPLGEIKASHLERYGDWCRNKISEAAREGREVEDVVALLDAITAVLLEARDTGKETGDVLALGFALPAQMEGH